MDQSRTSRRTGAHACLALALAAASMAAVAQTTPAPATTTPPAATKAAPAATKAAPVGNKAAPAAKAEPAAKTAAPATKAPAPATKTAAPGETPPPPIVTSGRHAAPTASTPEKQAKLVKRMTEQVNLTPDQQARVNAVYNQQRTDIAAINQKYANAPRGSNARGEAISDARELANAKISGILTDEQMTKWVKVQNPGMVKYEEDMRKRLAKTPKPAKPAS